MWSAGVGVTHSREPQLVRPGYHHLDVGGPAAGTQNTGKPNEVSASLTRFILTGVPGPA